MDALAGQPIEGSGTPESVWRAAAVLQHMPQVSLGALLQDARRLVVVAPHPDDEVLGCGGLMAAAQAHGIPVCVIALTDGEMAYPHVPAWAPHLLAPARRQELDAALAALGLTNNAATHCDLGDGALHEHEDAMTRAIASQLQPEDLVLVTWHRDAHPDHEAAARATRAACARHGVRLLTYPVWAWHWSQPGDGVFEDDRALRFELTPAVHAAKQRAITCFSTQLGTCTPPVNEPILPPHVLARFDRTFEVFLA